MQTAFDVYSADQMFGYVADSARDLQEALEILRNTMDKPELRCKALELAIQMAQRIESVSTDAALAYGPDAIPGGVSGFIRQIGRRSA